MALQITRWRPDTCGCVIEYSWDNSVPEEKRTHSFHKLVNKCRGHQGNSDEDVYKSCLEENPRKNLALARIMEKFPHLTETITDEAGNTSTRFKKEHEPTFKFDSNRKLAINIPNLSSKDKNLAQAEVNKNISGKIDLA